MPLQSRTRSSSVTLRQEENFESHRDIRFDILDQFKYNRLNNLQIEIFNTETKESFVRQVTDVTTWKDWYIISW